MTIARIPTACLIGVWAEQATIEIARAPHGGIALTPGPGFPREAAERVGCALRNAGNPVPPGSYTFHLAADSPVPGGDRHLDLAVAVGALAAAGELSRASDWMVAGELALDGALRPVRGAVVLAAAARDMGLAGIVVPRPNMVEASLVEGVEVRGAETLSEVIQFLRCAAHLPAGDRPEGPTTPSAACGDFSDVMGQEHVKRAMEVTAAGAHNVLLVGPPGAGKTMIAQRMPGILPPLRPDEALEIAATYSVAGLLLGDSVFVAQRPFRCPHFTVSEVGMIGGGMVPRPGEASLAHLGVLFADELAEFRRTVLESVRRAMEEKVVVLTRSGIETVFPASFMLVAAMNPCPCGYRGDGARRCICSPGAYMRYRSRVSQPLMDRIDLQVEVPAVRYREIAERRRGEPSEAIRERVLRAREIQRDRFEGCTARTNTEMTPAHLREFCSIDEGGDALMRTAITRLGLSARAYHKVLKIARTIADLDGGGDIMTLHLSEAIQYRSLDRT